MDALLNTQSESAQLTMRNVRIFEDGSGGQCLLEVTSSPFTAKFDFFFDHPQLIEFAEKLQMMHNVLSGEARLGQQYEESYILFSASKLGHINVQGRLVMYGQHTQSLAFSFSTDQTSLPGFIANLKAIHEAHSSGGKNGT